MGWVGEALRNVVETASQLGALPVTAVWALFTLVLLLYIVWDMRTKRSSSDQAWNARLKEADADNAMANAMGKLADQIREIRQKIKCGGPDA